MYKLAVPHPDLLPFIENYWAVTAGPGEEVDLSVDVFVDARADLVFNFGAPYTLPRGYKGYYPPALPRDFAPNVVRFVQDDGKR